MVVHDRVTTETGELVEDTYDWYAQDRDGNVWYLGEDTKAYEGKKISTEGSWEHGVDGAKAGIAMPGEPWVGLSYYQEFYRGHAEDAGPGARPRRLGEVPYGSFENLLKTADTTALEPDLIEHKYYAPGIGLVYEQTVRGGDDEVRLLKFTRGRYAQNGASSRPAPVLASTRFRLAHRAAQCVSWGGRAGPGLEPAPAL